jgi:LPXTG-motif cell wall-anchored protein
MRQHLYMDTALLNADYKAVPLQGLGGGVLGSTHMGSLSGPLGAEGDYPWREKSAATKALQQIINNNLGPMGYLPLDADGVLGAATCGAAKFVVDKVSDTMVFVPDTCQSFTPPTKKGTGGGALPKPTDPGLTTARMYGGGGMSDTMWIVLGGLAAAGAVGIAVYMKKKKH